MKSILLTIGGVAQILILLLHVGIFYGIESTSELGASAKVTAHIFNAAVTTAVLFFAYVSLFRKQELQETVLGRIVCVFIATFYIQRGLVEVFLRGLDPLNLSLAVAIALLYVIVALPSKRAVAVP